MDNDNALLEAARNLYKGWRFGWKYRGVRVLDAEAATTWPGQPFKRAGRTSSPGAAPPRCAPWPTNWPTAAISPTAPGRISATCPAYSPTTTRR